MLSKRIGLLCLAVVLAVCIVAVEGVGQYAAEYWNRIPLDMKTQITTHDFGGDRALSVMCFSGTTKAWGLLLPDSDVGFLSSLVDYLEEVFNGDSFILVAVAPDGNQYWSPFDIAFTQGYYQYSVGFGDYKSMTEAFDGGLLRAETVCSGMVRIPSEIDLAQPFKVWIGEDFGIIKAFYGEKGG